MKRDSTSDFDTAIEAAIDEYQKQQRPQLREMLEMEHVLRNIDRTLADASARRMEELLTEKGADVDLQRLVTEGCDRAHVIQLLVGLEGNLQPPRWLGFGNRNELANAIKKLEQADTVIGVVQPNLRLLSYLSNVWPWFAMFPILSSLLQNYQTLLRFVAESTESSADVARELLVAHVIEKTGAPFDKEVAAIIAALPGRGGYSEEAHSKWRRRDEFLRSGSSVPE